MLIIFAGIPIAAPGKAVFDKETVAEVVFIDLVGKIQTAVGVNLTSCGRNIGIVRAVFVEDYIRIIERVDINGKAVGVLRETGSAVHDTVVKAGSVIICHGSRVIAIVLID